MTATWKRTLITLLIITVGVSIVIAVVSSLAANAKPRLQTWTERQSSFCPEFPNGNLHGWHVQVRKTTNDTGTHVWTFGPWDGSYCENNFRLWNIRWGDAPDHATNPLLLWKWDQGYMHISDQDTKGDTQHRTWVAHFHSSAGPFHRDCYPRMTVTIYTGGNTRLGTAENC